MIDKSILKELKEALEKCTPGEWVAIPNPKNRAAWWRVDNKQVDWANFGQIFYASEHDAKLCVLSHNHMLSLLNSYEELEKERTVALKETEQIRADIANALRLEAGDRKRQYFIPAEPCPIGPLGIVEAAQKYMEMVDAADKSAESSRDQMKQTVRTLADALRNVKDAAVTDADTCSICLQDFKTHSNGDCPMSHIDAALSDPIVKQIVEEKSS